MKDKQTGEPNGMFLDNAQASHHQAHPAAHAGGKRARHAPRRRARAQDSAGPELHVASSSYSEMDLLQETLQRKQNPQLPLRSAMLGPSDDTARLLSEGPLMDAFDQQLTCRAIKVSFDGALGSKGAALLEKYSDYDTSGFLKWKEDDLLPMFDERPPQRHSGVDPRHRRPRQPRNSAHLRKGA